MADFDIKKGWFKNIEGDGLPGLMSQVFGNVREENGTYVSSYGVMERIEARIVSKTVLDITTVNKKFDPSEIPDSEVLDSKRKLNEFAEKATGFDAKARMKRAQKKAKEGTLRGTSWPISIRTATARTRNAPGTETAWNAWSSIKPTARRYRSA